MATRSLSVIDGRDIQAGGLFYHALTDQAKTQIRNEDYDTRTTILALMDIFNPLVTQSKSISNLSYGDVAATQKVLEIQSKLVVQNDLARMLPAQAKLVQRIMSEVYHVGAFMMQRSSIGARPASMEIPKSHVLEMSDYIGASVSYAPSAMLTAEGRLLVATLVERLIVSLADSVEYMRLTYLIESSLRNSSRFVGTTSHDAAKFFKAMLHQRNKQWASAQKDTLTATSAQVVDTMMAMNRIPPRYAIMSNNTWTNFKLRSKKLLEMQGPVENLRYINSMQFVAGQLLLDVVLKSDTIVMDTVTMETIAQMQKTVTTGEYWILKPGEKIKIYDHHTNEWAEVEWGGVSETDLSIGSYGRPKRITETDYFPDSVKRQKKNFFIGEVPNTFVNSETYQDFIGKVFHLYELFRPRTNSDLIFFYVTVMCLAKLIARKATNVMRQINFLTFGLTVFRRASKKSVFEFFREYLKWNGKTADKKYTYTLEEASPFLKFYVEFCENFSAEVKEKAFLFFESVFSNYLSLEGIHLTTFYVDGPPTDSALKASRFLENIEKFKTKEITEEDEISVFFLDFNFKLTTKTSGFLFPIKKVVEEDTWKKVKFFRNNFSLVPPENFFLLKLIEILSPHLDHSELCDIIGMLLMNQLDITLIKWETFNEFGVFLQFLKPAEVELALKLIVDNFAVGDNEKAELTTILEEEIRLYQRQGFRQMTKQKFIQYFDKSPLAEEYPPANPDAATEPDPFQNWDDDIEDVLRGPAANLVAADHNAANLVAADPNAANPAAANPATGNKKVLILMRPHMRQNTSDLLITNEKVGDVFVGGIERGTGTIGDMQTQLLNAHVLIHGTDFTGVGAVHNCTVFPYYAGAGTKYFDQQQYKTGIQKDFDESLLVLVIDAKDVPASHEQLRMLSLTGEFYLDGFMDKPVSHPLFQNNNFNTEVERKFEVKSTRDPKDEKFSLAKHLHCYPTMTYGAYMKEDTHGTDTIFVSQNGANGMPLPSKETYLALAQRTLFTESQTQTVHLL